MKRITKFIFYTILPLIKILVFAGFVYIIDDGITVNRDISYLWDSINTATESDKISQYKTKITRMLCVFYGIIMSDFMQERIEVYWDLIKNTLYENSEILKTD